MKNRAVLYARVSTRKQDEVLQLPRLEKMAEQRGYQIVAELTDEASGRNGNRPGWKKVMAMARAGECDVIMAVKLDRVMRSLPDLYNAMVVLDRANVRLETEDFDQDPKSPNGRLILGFLGTLAEWERAVISERTKAALEERRARGTKLGRPAKDFAVHKAALSRLQGASWNETGRRTGVAASTLRRHKKEIEEEEERILAGDYPTTINSDERD